MPKEIEENQVTFENENENQMAIWEFSIKATRKQAKELKEYLESRGIEIL